MDVTWGYQYQYITGSSYPENSDVEKLSRRKRSGLKVCVRPRQTKRPTSVWDTIDIFDAVNLNANREAHDRKIVGLRFLLFSVSALKRSQINLIL